jgi:Anaerobic dehydrogenases, typically selenocysteine-containing
MDKHEPASYSVRGYCALCTAHCATIATVKAGKVTQLVGDPDHPNGGVFCVKGKAAPELVYHPDRLDYPLKRTRPKGDSRSRLAAHQLGSSAGRDCRKAHFYS